MIERINKLLENAPWISNIEILEIFILMCMCIKDNRLDELEDVQTDWSSARIGINGLMTLTDCRGQLVKEKKKRTEINKLISELLLDGLLKMGNVQFELDPWLKKIRKRITVSGSDEFGLYFKKLTGCEPDEFLTMLSKERQLLNTLSGADMNLQINNDFQKVYKRLSFSESTFLFAINSYWPLEFAERTIRYEKRIFHSKERMKDSMLMAGFQILVQCEPIQIVANYLMAFLNDSENASLLNLYNKYDIPYGLS